MVREIGIGSLGSFEELPHFLERLGFLFFLLASLPSTYVLLSSSPLIIFRSLPTGHVPPGLVVLPLFLLDVDLLLLISSLEPGPLHFFLPLSVDLSHLFLLLPSLSRLCKLNLESPHLVRGHRVPAYVVVWGWLKIFFLSDPAISVHVRLMLASHVNDCVSLGGFLVLNFCRPLVLFHVKEHPCLLLQILLHLPRDNLNIAIRANFQAGLVVPPRLSLVVGSLLLLGLSWRLLVLLELPPILLLPLGLVMRHLLNFLLLFLVLFILHVALPPIVILFTDVLGAAQGSTSSGRLRAASSAVASSSLVRSTLHIIST